MSSSQSNSANLALNLAIILIASIVVIGCEASTGIPSPITSSTITPTSTSAPTAKPTSTVTSNPTSIPIPVIGGGNGIIYFAGNNRTLSVDASCVVAMYLDETIECNSFPQSGSVSVASVEDALKSPSGLRTVRQTDSLEYTVKNTATGEESIVSGRVAGWFDDDRALISYVRPQWNYTVYNFETNDETPIQLGIFIEAFPNLPVVSPNGQYIAFSFRTQNTEDYEIYVLDTMCFDTSDCKNQLVRLTDNTVDECLMSWSPDSLWLAFVRAGQTNLDTYSLDARNLDSDIYVVDIDQSLIQGASEEIRLTINGQADTGSHQTLCAVGRPVWDIVP